VQLIGEMLGLAERIEEKHLQLELLAFRIYDLSSLCDIEGIQRDLTAFGQISEEIGEPFYEYNYQTMSVAPMIQNGQFEDAERMTMAAFDTAQQLGVDNHEGVMGVQMFTIRREQGRLAEIAPVVQHFVNEQGSGAAWRPGLALIYADIGELGKARAEFELLAADQFGAIPRDSLWQTSLAYLAETCCAINAVSAAEVLYELLLPYRDLAVVVGNASVFPAGHGNRFADFCNDLAAAYAVLVQPHAGRSGWARGHRVSEEPGRCRGYYSRQSWPAGLAVKNEVE
jgi:hypothetical protein